MPFLGAGPLVALAGAGSRAAALEAGSVILLDKTAVLARARALGISLLGF